jgi:tetratricopeptide (TPR) repeat protein
VGLSLGIRFQRLRNLEDLDNAIVSQQEAVDLTPQSHPQKPRRLSSLGNSLEARFQRLGDRADIDNAIISQRTAIALAPYGHPSKSMYLANLGISLWARFQRLGDLGDLDLSITSKQEAIELLSDGHPEKPSCLSNLGSSLQARFNRLGDVADLDNAIASKQAAVDLTPDGHRQKPSCFNNLGNSLVSRFELLGDLVDLDKAIISYQAAVDLSPEGHFQKLMFLNGLASAFSSRFHYLQRPQDAEAAISHFSTSATSKSGPPIPRFNAAKGWSSIASLTGHPSLLASFECAIGLIPHVAWLGLPMAHRHEHLVEIGGITRNAAAVAISLGVYDKALEWLEQGRSIVWTQILQLRTSVDDLRNVHPDLAKRLVEVSQLLDQGPEQDDLSSRRMLSVHEEGRRYRGLTAEWESLIEQVRSLPGFGHFLRPLSSLQLMKAAQGDPVVVLNIADQRCDALALIPGLDEVIHIPLPNITSKKVKDLEDDLKDLLHSSGVRMRGERAAKKVEDEADDECCKRILAEIWTSLVKPILDSLAFSVRLISSLMV